ncbi:MAG: hypothetical protein GDA46_07255 [Bdellovibrionales bacterium]|nr:hypothetical protein [Bdellovibrionales bacterium]
MSSLYKLPKIILAFIFIGGAVFLIIVSEPPHTLCDTQIQNFKQNQKGFIYNNSKDFHKNKSILKRKKKNCEEGNSQGSCHDYFFLLKKILKDLQLISNECKPQIFADTKVKKTFAEALTLMTALAWREEVVLGHLSKINWLTKTDLSLFCQIKSKYLFEYGRNSYKKLEKQIINLIPNNTKNKSLLLKWSLLSEDCYKYL